MIKLETIKRGLHIVVNVGVSAIVGGIVKNATSEEEGSLKRACIFTGGLVLGFMFSDKANEYLDKKIDSEIEEFKKIKEEMKQEKKED